MKADAIFLVLLMVFVSAPASCTLHSNESGRDEMAELTLTLSMDKSTYRLGESMRVSTSLQNTGDKDVIIHNRMALNSPNAPELVRDITYIIMGPTGERVPFLARVSVRPTNTDDFIVLSPGETIEQSYNIDEFYYIRDIGSYTIFAVYQNMLDSDNNIPIWKGELTSNSEMFEITP